MLFTSLIQWWYGDGWKWRTRLVRARLEDTIDFFSITLLLKTLFQPFRQISAGKVEGSLDERLRALADKLISRVIGAGIRLVIIAVGVIAITIHVLLGCIILIGWAIVPALPIAGIILMFTGWAF